ncbi:MAG TPA: matrixin family metalloprotease [Gemmataceae bacterium]|nr:matrixin family metalloprotease [Gemmataceae bacterium]
MTLRARVFSFLFGNSSRRAERARPRLEALEGRDCPSVAFQFDYSMDSSGFFNNPQARATLQLAGQLLSSQLNDSLGAIVPGGVNHWNAGVTNPSTGGTAVLSDLSVPADTIIVYAGGRNYGGAQLGEGGYGSWSASGSTAWLNAVGGRGQPGALGSAPTDYAPWGGSVTFDTVSNWNFGDTSAGPAPGQFDFLSVAEHELGHVLGIGTAGSWQDKVSGGHFFGAASSAVYGGAPPVDGAGAHWAPGTAVGGAVADMVPSIPAGARHLFTALDFAGLQDIGWQVGGAAAPAPTPVAGAGTVPPQTIGAFDAATGTWYLRNANGAGPPDGGQFQYGGPGWVGLVGDWNGTGETGIGGFDVTTGTWYLRNEASAGAPDAGVFRFGSPGWIPVVGDWNGTGHTGIGGFDPATGMWYLRNEASGGAPDAGAFQYGAAGWRPVVGDWAGTGRAGIGLFDPAHVTWYLRDSATPGAPDFAPFAYGGSSWVPLAGNWHGPAVSARRADRPDPLAGGADAPFVDM